MTPWIHTVLDIGLAHPCCQRHRMYPIFFVVCDGLKGLPDSASAAFPLVTVQTCIIHLIRNTFTYASRKY